jgi:urease accessory protein
MPLDCALPEATWRARLALAFERRGERSVLATREHDGPLVVQKPLHPEGPEVCHAIIVHPPAGIAAGDRLVMDIAARERAHALLTTPGAAKWYRSAGAWARQHVSIEARALSHVEWLPQETIIFDAARADIRWDARLEGDARLIAWDIVRLGPLARRPPGMDRARAHRRRRARGALGRGPARRAGLCHARLRCADRR